MPSGLVALLDDAAAIAKIAAASLDDVGAAAGKASAKAAGVVVDDTAVTPNYLIGFTPDRELPVIGKIALGSLINKLVLILPIALLLSQYLPWAITPILMIGGAYLAFEGVEKLLDAMVGDETSLEQQATELSGPEHERKMVSSAIRTDFILSSEIMAISLAEVASFDLWMRAAALAIVALVITAAVYGVVALLVKMDDVGLALARGQFATGRALGRGLVRAMPSAMAALSAIGTVAMLWVGGGIILHGLEAFHLTPIPSWTHRFADMAAHVIPPLGALLSWLVTAVISALIGILIGGLIAAALHLGHRKLRKG